MNPVVLFAGFAVLVAVIAILGYLGDKRRRERLAAWAGQRGYTYDPRKRRPDWAFELMGRGSNRYVRDLFEGRLHDAVAGLGDAHAMLFEYHYETRSGSGEDESVHHHRHTCVLVQPGLELGRVRWRREGLFDRFVQLIGFEDVDLDDPEFSRAFRVTAADPREAYELFGPAMMDYLLRHAEFEVETVEGMLLAHLDGAPDLVRLERCDRFARGFLENLPRLIVNRERERRGLAPVLEAGAAARGSGSVQV